MPYIGCYYSPASEPAQSFPVQTRNYRAGFYKVDKIASDTYVVTAVQTPPANGTSLSEGFTIQLESQNTFIKPMNHQYLLGCVHYVHIFEDNVTLGTLL